LSDRDGRGLAAHPERMARDQGPPDDVRRAPREGTAAHSPGGPADRRRRREGPAGTLRPGRLECRGGQPASFGGGGPCDLPRSPPRARGLGTRIRRTVADPSEPEREGRTYHAYVMSVSGGGSATGTFATQFGSTRASGEWTVSGREILDAHGLEILSSVIDLEANGTLHTNPIPLPFALSVQNTTS